MGEFRDSGIEEIDKLGTRPTAFFAHGAYLGLESFESCSIIGRFIFDDTELRLYRERDAVEKFFDDMKNSMDMDRLRVHSSWF